ncbi:MAG: hypothetical protein IAE87_19335 [Rhodobacteraceae bacterium]|jgi:hypothetical protein|nr:hypothetical protein [Paracoccaceae bacterium]
MPIVVTVRIPNVDIERVRQVAKDHKDLSDKLRESIIRNGCTAHRRIYNEELREIMDVDEWESEEGVRQFLKEMGPTIAKLAELRGTGKPEDTIWRVY